MNTLETEFDTLTVCPGCGTQGDAQAMLTVCPRDGRRFVPITEWFQRRDDPLLGCVVGGRYAVVGVIGHGGMGDIYRAVHLGLGRQVAVKLLRGGGLEAGGDARQAILDEKFQAEAQYAALVDGPGTVKLLDAGVDEGRGGQRFMVFELLRGQTLDELLDVHGRLPAARVASLGEQIARALESVHAEGLLHADLKPANIMWLGDAHDTDAAGTPEVKLLDFGLSRLLSAPGRCTATAHGTPYMAGTLAYMAPEQMTAGPCDPRTDVYGLGATLHRLVTGVSVHASTGKHAQVGLRAVLADKRTAGPRALETVPPALAAVLRTALDPDPARRYPTAAAFAEALAGARRGMAAIGQPEGALLASGMSGPGGASHASVERRPEGASHASVERQPGGASHTSVGRQPGGASVTQLAFAAAAAFLLTVAGAAALSAPREAAADTLTPVVVHVNVGAAP